MVEFITLFVGLVLGVQQIEVAVSGPVARVEIRVDERLLATATGPSWTATCNFGRELHPSRLEAVAYDESGRVLGRDERWINLPGMRADAEIVGIRDDRGKVTGARLTWSSPEFDKPKKILVTLDGEPVKVRPPYLVDLESVPARRVHVLTAEFQFSSQVVLRRELVFGPGFEGSQDSGLTAVAVSLDDLDELPPADAMDGWFATAVGVLSVAAVEKPDPRVVIVRDPTVVGRLDEMLPELERRRKKARRDPRQRRKLDVLDDDTEIFALSPEPVRPGGREDRAVLFPFSNRSTAGADGIVAAAVGTSAASLMGGPLMMSDAVAVAGIRAAEGNGRRAVVMLLGPQREDGSRFEPGVARRYLEDLRVPLLVWDLSGPGREVPGGWGDSLPVDNLDDVVRAARRLRYRLEEQRIVWVRGRHLPQEIVLTDKAQGISLAN
ncbi:MAG: hypothetical protein V2I67_06255 [Thermoanaerobaculales bacterium]|jgi:hypothetical protein|nr:hypothetical protein [Thermoanaerobaculales bacterium]